MAEEKNKPIKTIGAGQVSISKWENEGKEGMKNISFTLQKSYKDGEDWKTTSSYFERDLVNLRELINNILSERVKEKGKKAE
jgi:hypothetical protein